jgi:hypothetical protein
LQAGAFGAKFEEGRPNWIWNNDTRKARKGWLILDRSGDGLRTGDERRTADWPISEGHYSVLPARPETEYAHVSEMDYAVDVLGKWR